MPLAEKGGEARVLLHQHPQGGSPVEPIPPSILAQISEEGEPMRLVPLRTPGASRDRYGCGGQARNERIAIQ